VIIKQPVQNVIVELGWQGPSIGKDDAATYAADVFLVHFAAAKLALSASSG